MRAGSQRGSVTLWVLGLCVLLLFVGGLSVDLWRVFSERRALAAAADAAAVAGADATDTDLYRSTGRVRLDPALAERQALDSIAAQTDRRSLVSVSAHATPDGITVEATGRVEFSLLRIFLADQAPFTVRVQASADPRRSP